MRHVVALLFTLLVTTTGAFAQDYSINTIVGYVDMAEMRFKEGDANSARSNLENARQMLPGASAEAKADKRFKELDGRMAKLDKLIAAKEASAATTADADEKFNKADSEEMQARISAGSDNYEESLALYKSCLTYADQAAAIDPTIKQRTSNGSHTYAELVTKCKAGVVEMTKQSTGEGKDAATTEQGKLALAGFAVATKAVASKKVTTMEMAAALKGAEDCKNNVSYLTSIRLRNDKAMWDRNATKLGDLSLDAMWKKCEKMSEELQAKPAVGCGKHFLGVSQERPSIVDHWRAAEGSKKMPFEAIECSEMPKTSQLPGLSASYKGKFVAACGADAVFIIIHNKWLESRLQRVMQGDCYKKGSLNINR